MKHLIAAAANLDFPARRQLSRSQRAPHNRRDSPDLSTAVYVIYCQEGENKNTRMPLY